MAITTDPTVLYMFNDASGTAPANENTGNSSGTIVTNGGSSAWSAADAGSYKGYLDLQDDQAVTYVQTNETGLANSQTTSESLAMRFQVQSYDTRASSLGYLFSAPVGSIGETKGQIVVSVDDPSSGGGSPNDFNLIVHYYGGLYGYGGQQVFADQTFGTDIALAVSVDRSDYYNVDARIRKDAESEVGTLDYYGAGDTLETTLGRICCGYGFTDSYGVEARLYYFAYWRGYAISATDLPLCNSAPSTTIPLWPADSGGIIPQAMHTFKQRNNY